MCQWLVTRKSSWRRRKKASGIGPMPRCRPSAPGSRRPRSASRSPDAGRVGYRSVVVQPLFDQLLGRDPPGGIEAAVFEELLVLEVDVVLAAAILLHRCHDPVAVALRLVGVELDVDLGNDVVLVVQ